MMDVQYARRAVRGIRHARHACGLAHETSRSTLSWSIRVPRGVATRVVWSRTSSEANGHLTELRVTDTLATLKWPLETREPSKGGN